MTPLPDPQLREALERIAYGHFEARVLREIASEALAEEKQEGADESREEVIGEIAYWIDKVCTGDTQEDWKAAEAIYRNVISPAPPKQEEPRCPVCNHQIIGHDDKDGCIECSCDWGEEEARQAVADSKQEGPRQDPLGDQIIDLHRLAVENGMYDAADWIQRRTEPFLRKAALSAPPKREGPDETWLCRGCGRWANTYEDLLRLGCEGKPERFVLAKQEGPAGEQLESVRHIIEDRRYSDEFLGNLIRSRWSAPATQQQGSTDG